MEMLNDFIDKSRRRLEVILERLQLTEEDVRPKLTTGKGLLNCDDDNDDEPPLPPSCGSIHQVSLTVEDLRYLLNDGGVEHPQRFSDLQVNFSREQKLRLYEHVIQCTGKCTEPEPPMPLLHDGQLSFAEIVALKNRETKKKRKYRKSKPTQIEEVKALVELQMQALQQYWRGDETERGRDQRREHPEGNYRCSRSGSRRRDEWSARQSDPYYNGREQRQDGSYRRSRRSGSHSRDRSSAWQRYSEHYENDTKGRRQNYSPKRRELDVTRRHNDESHSRGHYNSSSRESNYDHKSGSSRKRSRSKSRRYHRSPSRTKRRHRSSSVSSSSYSSKDRINSSSSDHHRRKKSKHKSKHSHSDRHPKSHK